MPHRDATGYATREVTYLAEIWNSGQTRKLHSEEFTYRPETHYRDPHARLASAKMAYRKYLLEQMENEKHPLHVMRSRTHEFRFMGSLKE